MDINEIESLTARMAAALVQLRQLRAEVSVVVVVPGHDDRSRFRESVDKITKTLTLPTETEHDRIRKETFAAVRVSANTPADPTKCCAAETTEGVTAHERDCPRFTPEAVAYRRARRAEVQQLMSQPLTPAEARTGISDRTAAALADAADLRRLTFGLADMGLPDLSDHLDVIEQALRAGGAAAYGQARDRAHDRLWVHACGLVIGTESQPVGCGWCDDQVGRWLPLMVDGGAA